MLSIARTLRFTDLHDDQAQKLATVEQAVLAANGDWIGIAKIAAALRSADIVHRAFLEEVTAIICKKAGLDPDEVGDFNFRPNAPCETLADLAQWAHDIAVQQSHGQYSPIHSMLAPANDLNPVKDKIAEQLVRARTLMASRNQPMAAE